MRVAISGSHRTGKTTLVEELAALLPNYATIDEPYHLMEEEGYAFCHPPSLEDYEAQLFRSIESLKERGRRVFFDRCPVDFLGYIAVHEDADSFDWDERLPRIRVALQRLDLIVFVPVEAQGRIAFSMSNDDDGSRALVDDKLGEILLDDPFELGVEVLAVEGDPERRLRTVMESILRGRGRSRRR